MGNGAGVRSRAILRGVGRVVLALVCALVLTELALRALGLRPPGRGYASGDVLVKHIEESEAPGVGWVLEPNTEHEFAYPGANGGPPRIVHERINADGWRDRRYPRTRSPGVVRIAVQGDSVTYGTGVEAQDTFPKLLEKIYAARYGEGRVEVMNCGVFNTNTIQQAGLLRWRVLEWKPDLVFLCSTVADASGYGVPEGPPRERDWETRTSVALGLTSGVWDEGDLAQANDAQRRCMALRRASVLVDLLAHQSFAFLLGRAQARNYVEGWRPGSPGRAAVAGALDRFVALTAQRGVRLRAGMFPFLSDLDESHPFRPVHATYDELCRERGIATVDLLRPFLGLDAGRLRAHAHDRHPNPAGHRIAAEELANALAKDVEALLAR